MSTHLFDPEIKVPTAFYEFIERDIEDIRSKRMKHKSSNAGDVLLQKIDENLFMCRIINLGLQAWLWIYSNTKPGEFNKENAYAKEFRELTEQKLAPSMSKKDLLVILSRYLFWYIILKRDPKDWDAHWEKRKEIVNEIHKRSS